MTKEAYLSDVLAAYLDIYPFERQKFDLLQRQILANEVLENRRNFTGHITGSAIILSSDRKKILLIHHKAYNKWQQPGGHWEASDGDPLAVAAREGVEETGLKQMEYVPIRPDQQLVPIDIDSHPVAARPSKGEPPHYHHDFRYVFVAEEEGLEHQQEEVESAGWFNFDNPETSRVQKVIKKLKMNGLIS